MRDILKKIINILTFTDLPVRKKFLLFSLGSLFWLAVISAIGLITMFDMSAKSKQMVDVIGPQEKTVNIIVRKLRGASISAHKIVLYKNTERVNNNYLSGKARLEDCRSYLKILLTGGRIKDYSRGTGQFYNEFIVVPVKSAEKRKFIEDVIVKVDRLEGILAEMAEKKFGSTNGDAMLEKLSEYDLLTRDTVTVLNEFAITTGKEWGTFTSIIKTRFNIAIILISLAFGIAAMLSGVFGVLISRSLAKPIKAIIGQIKALSSGEMDLTKKLDVASKDELGMLSSEFNRLMDTIEHVTSFKKIIEEDESIEDIYMRLGKIFIEDLGFDNCVMYEVSNSKNNMKIVYPPEAEGIELHCKRDIQLDCELCRVKRTGHMVSSADYSNICKYYTEGVNDIHYCVPIMIGGNVGGVVQFVCGKRGVCDIDDIKKKISRAKQYITDAQPVLEAKRLMKTLKESAFKDALTGLYNRRFLEESFENLVAGALRRGTTLGLLMCDLDFFKQTNDVYGHDVGDMVLKEAANNIRKNVRTSDLVIRFGGEEFLVLLIDTKPGDSFDVAEKIRERIEESKVKIAGGFIQKTISIGVSEFPTDTQNFWEAIKFADVALYKAKERGRNKVLRFAMDMWAEEKY
ncbi:MAG: diguanylate cyclase [Thermodesulfovibrionales bacterium]|jgi:diguanylate cyclase (GGDEF)-like protein|nr:diguanylate cyclase [Thermodesulfovibrionales bacterium]